MNGFGRKRQIIYYLCRQNIGRGEKNDHWLVRIERTVNL